MYDNYLENLLKQSNCLFEKKENNGLKIVHLTQKNRMLCLKLNYFQKRHYNDFHQCLLFK